MGVMFINLAIVWGPHFVDLVSLPIPQRCRGLCRLSAEAAIAACSDGGQWSETK